VNKRRTNNNPLAALVRAATERQTHESYDLTQVRLHARGIMIVVAIIGLLAAIAIPNFVRARNTAQKNTCINNLRQIDGAKQQWALENKKSDTDSPASGDVQNYIKNNAYPTCLPAAPTLSAR